MEIAVFDLDGTITRGDTYLAFLMAVLRARPLRLPQCAGLVGPLIGFVGRRVSNDTLKQRFLSAIVRGETKESLAPVVSSFIGRCRHRMVKEAACKRIAWHLGQGHRIVLATASLDVYAEPLGHELGFPEIISTQVDWRDDAVSGTLASDNLRGEHKLAAVRRSATLAAYPGALLTVYSDHHSDLPLLTAAHRAVAVDPTARLAAEARERGFEIVNWGEQQ